MKEESEGLVDVMGNLIKETAGTDEKEEVGLEAAHGMEMDVDK